MNTNDQPTVLDELTRLNSEISKRNECLRILARRNAPTDEIKRISDELHDYERQRNNFEQLIIRRA